MRILFIFIDGLGIGEYNLATNPCANKKLVIFNNFSDRPFSKNLPFHGSVKAIDATLDLPGLPQSATGQTALLTGINVAKMLGRHVSGYPTSQLREILSNHSLLKKYAQLNKKAAFINAYRPIFFEFGPEALIRYLSVTSIANWKAGLKFFSFENLKSERSIYHDFTNVELKNKGFDVPVFDAKKAGQILAKAAESFDFCLYEYFKTDKAGHAQDLNQASELLYQLELFLLSVLENVNLQHTLFLLTSDHGNMEDLSVKTHTRNPVPLMLWGLKKEYVFNRVEKIEDIAPTLLQLV